MVRSLLTVDASLGGAGRFVISNADMVVREEWARFSTADSALSGMQIVSATMLSHDSAFPNRSVIADLNGLVKRFMYKALHRKKDDVRPSDIPPNAVPSVPASGSDERPNDGKKRRDYAQSFCGVVSRRCPLSLLSNVWLLSFCSFCPKKVGSFLSFSCSVVDIPRLCLFTC